MKKNLFTLLLLFLSITSYAQKEVSYVIGIETSSIFRSYKNNIGKGLAYSYGVSLEYPINQFSLGVGILQTNYGKNYYEYFTGESSLSDGKKVYEYFRKEFSLNYITISNRLQYRFPCNCVYVHIGYNLEVLSWINEKRIDNSISRTGEEPYGFREKIDLKKINTSVEFGLGFKMQINEMLRIFMRPTYNITSKPSKHKNRFYQNEYHYLRMTFGLQLGI